MMRTTKGIDGKYQESCPNFRDNYPQLIHRALGGGLWADSQVQSTRTEDRWSRVAIGLLGSTDPHFCNLKYIIFFNHAKAGVLAWHLTVNETWVCDEALQASHQIVQALSQLV